MQFFERISRIRSLISERDAIDQQLRELIGEADNDRPKRGRPKKENGGTNDVPPRLPLDQSSIGASS